jgi:hypothetical protein
VATTGPSTSKSRPAVRVQVPAHVAWRAFPAETVLLNLQTGQYHGLNPTGGRMFEVIGECGDSEIAAARLAAEFDQPLRTISEDLRELCEGLLSRGLLERTAG